MAVNPNPPCLDVLMIFYPDKYYSDDDKANSQVVEKEAKWTEQVIEYTDYGLIPRISFPNNIPLEK